MFLIGLFVLSQVARPETVLVCRFGKDKGQIGVTFADMAYGPAFGVDQYRNIYIIDSENNRIEAFKNNGVFWYVISVPEMNYSGVSGNCPVAFKDDTVYYGFGNFISVRTSSGKDIRRIKGQFLLNMDFRGYLHTLPLPHYPVKSEGEIEKSPPKMVVSPDLSDTIAIIKRGNTPRYYSYDRIIETKGEIRFYKMRLRKTKFPIVPEKVLLNEYIAKGDTFLFRMEGEDKEGNFYINFCKGKGGLCYERFLKKFNHNGKYLGEIKYGIKVFGDLGNEIYLSPTGDFYVANMDNEKYWIVKYPKEMFKK